MIGAILRIAGLTAVYLLVLTSLAPLDIMTGALVATVIVGLTHPGRHRPAAGWLRWSQALIGTLLSTASEVIAGTVRTVRFCLGWQAAPGFVEIPRGDRSVHAVALWGVLTGEAPDEYPVDVDDARDVLVVHVLDARDRPAIVARHAHAYERWQRHVVR
ncbi:MAG TPA: Na+/H+ antiporter subunit E [Candidatus Limnocylindrales bacterium]|nr:Na+/H+ antiporter subunit E [Candidatus Limnocylindrales bacterium]